MPTAVQLGANQHREDIFSGAASLFADGYGTRNSPLGTRPHHHVGTIIADR
ncbi:hypothetical protein G3I19_05810 [Streptomyces sp. SID10853]|uniref:hypothetical protein n=1 Tax=Streptomyces sp. SID10853 TaxID=2706028 RepID=UPI0013BEF1C6|nr:hypothetical protein [Streptomyces sp. SID10853]NDZ78050.1 hypothetical protein [Streptomyces sp. SID10853]